jgi:hypothetical protein
MKNLSIVIVVFLFAFQTIAQDKNELKALSKKHNEFDQNPYEKATQVAISGNNIRFRVAAHQSEINSWKDEKSYKFGAYAVLTGVNDQVFKEISIAYQKMLIAKFTELGIEVLPYDRITTTKSFSKLNEKYWEEPFNGTKGWGAALIYNYDNHDFLAWNGSSPLGPHMKVAKELKALLYNSQVTIDFCRIGIDIEQYRKSSPSIFSSGGIYTASKASIVPVVFVQHYTYNPQGTKMREDNTYSITINESGKLNNLILNTNPSEIESETNYAVKSDKCNNYIPDFAKGKLRLSESNMGTVQITANPELYKQAVLDVLQQYLNETFALYAATRN